VISDPGLGLHKKTVLSNNSEPAADSAGSCFCNTEYVFRGGMRVSALLLILAVVLFFAATVRIAAVDVLPSCPESPNCVSSKADKSDVLHYIEPFPFLSQDKELSYTNLMKILKRNRYCTIQSSNDVLISTYFTHPYLGLKNDVFFFFDLSQKVIHVYSASRIGYTDNGKNRERLEGIRKKYLDSIK
jgi:uncharacterized protein (DUF1499 family)